MAIPLAVIPEAVEVAKAIPAAVGAVAGIFQGIGQRAKARKIDKNNPFVATSVNENILKNVGLAEQRARVGLPQPIYNNALNKINTAQTAGFRQVGRMGTGASIANVVRATQESLLGLTAQDAQAKLNAENTLMNQRNILAREQARVFDWNKAQPYLRKLQQAQQLRDAGTQNIFGGIGTLGNAITNAVDPEGASLKKELEMYRSMYKPS